MVTEENIHFKESDDKVLGVRCQDDCNCMYAWLCRKKEHKYGKIVIIIKVKHIPVLILLSSFLKV